MKNLLTYFAVDTGTDSNSTTTVNVPTTSADALFTNALNLTYFIAGVVTVIVIIIAAVMYTTSSGDAARVTRAKNLLTYGIVGLVIVLVAFTVTSFISGRFS